MTENLSNLSDSSLFVDDKSDLSDDPNDDSCIDLDDINDNDKIENNQNDDE